MEAIVRTLRQTFAVTGDAEITIEANPESLDREKAEAYVACGIKPPESGHPIFFR